MVDCEDMHSAAIALDCCGLLSEGFDGTRVLLQNGREELFSD
jgi:hypothetical protein